MTAEAEPEPTEPTEPKGETPKEFERLPEDHPAAKALAKANKEAEQYRLQLKEVEDSQKSEAQRLREQNDELKTTAQTTTAEAARLRVALRKGLTETQARRLVGSTEEELEADADALVADFSPAAPSRERPKERLKPGASPDSDPPPDYSELADGIISRGW